MWAKCRAHRTRVAPLPPHRVLRSPAQQSGAGPVCVRAQPFLPGAPIPPWGREGGQRLPPETSCLPTPVPRPACPWLPAARSGREVGVRSPSPATQPWASRETWSVRPTCSQHSRGFWARPVRSLIKHTGNPRPRGNLMGVLGRWGVLRTWGSKSHIYSLSPRPHGRVGRGQVPRLGGNWHPSLSGALGAPSPPHPAGSSPRGGRRQERAPCRPRDPRHAQRGLWVRGVGCGTIRGGYPHPSRAWGLQDGGAPSVPALAALLPGPSPAAPSQAGLGSSQVQVLRVQALTAARAAARPGFPPPLPAQGRARPPARSPWLRELAL